MTDNRSTTGSQSLWVPVAAIAALLSVAALGFVLMGGGPGVTEVARVALESGGEPAVAQVALPAGARVDLAVHFDELRYDGENHLVLHAELLQGGKPIATKKCRGFRIRGGFGSQNRTTQIRDECAFRVPEQGADALRISGEPERSTKLEFSALQIGVRVTAREE